MKILRWLSSVIILHLSHGHVLFEKLKAINYDADMRPMNGGKERVIYDKFKFQ